MRLRLVWGGIAAVIVLAAAGWLMGLFGSGGPAHILVIPSRLGSYVRRPQLEQQMNAKQLQQQVIAKSAGQARNVVDAVYEDSAGASAGKTPQMILLIGGNLAGTSPADFITSFRNQSKGAHIIPAGSLGGMAACVNAQASVAGSMALSLCTWADNDTFGVVASPTMNAARLAIQLRAIRPSVERAAK